MLLRLTLSLLSAEDKVLGLLVELSEAFLQGGVFAIQSLLSAEDRVLGLELSKVFSRGGTIAVLSLSSAEDRVLGLELLEVSSCREAQSGEPVEGLAVHNEYIDHTKATANSETVTKIPFGT